MYIIIIFINKASEFWNTGVKIFNLAKKREDELVEFVLINRLFKEEDDIKSVKLSEIEDILLTAFVLAKLNSQISIYL